MIIKFIKESPKSEIDFIAYGGGGRTFTQVYCMMSDDKIIESDFRVFGGIEETISNM